MNKLNVLDLFSGTGAFSLGLERAGMKTIALCETDESCVSKLNKNFPGVPVFGDIKKLIKNSQFKEIKKDIDVVCGGWPCQGNSVAGNKKGSEDERSGLWSYLIKVIKEVKPRYAILENVANVRSTQLAEVIKDLWKIGYDCEWHIISARSVGAVHLRERIWIIAYSNSDRSEQRLSISTKNKKESLQPRGNGKEWDAPQSNGQRLQRQRLSSGIQKKDSNTNCNANEIANSNNFRFWRAFASEKEKQEWWAKTSSSVNYWEEAQSIICGVDDGTSSMLDRAKRLGKEGETIRKEIRRIRLEIEKVRKERIKQLGNGLVPQIPELIGREIVNYEKGINNEI